MGRNERARALGVSMALDPSLQIVMVPDAGAVTVQWRTIARTRIGSGVVKGDVKSMRLDTAGERAAFMEGLAEAGGSRAAQEARGEG